MIPKELVLTHHTSKILRDYPGITNLDEAIRVVKMKTIPELKKMSCDFDGLPRYPKLNEGLVEKNLPRMIVAVNIGNYTEIPDDDSIGGDPRDGMCAACGNLIVLETSSGICDLKFRFYAAMMG